jgi:hypothetical protein
MAFVDLTFVRIGRAGGPEVCFRQFVERSASGTKEPVLLPLPLERVRATLHLFHILRVNGLGDSPPAGGIGGRTGPNMIVLHVPTAAGMAEIFGSEPLV